MEKLDRSKIIPFETIKSKIRQDSKVSFRWYGSGSLYTGRIEMKGNEPYFVNEFHYTESTPHVLEAMKYYNILESFGIFTEFNVLQY